jgi:hypothetical protein
MADDTGDKIAHALARQGIAALPFGSLVLNVAETFVNNADKNIQVALGQELLGDVLRLNSKVDELDTKLAAHSKQLDELGLLRTIAIFEEFLRAFSRARGDEKRDALLNIAARQFDPTLGSLPFRQRWFDAVASLGDTQIAALRAFEESGKGLCFIEDDSTIRRARADEVVQLSRRGPTNPQVQSVQLQLGTDEAVAMRDVLIELIRLGYVRGFRNAAQVRDPSDATWFLLSQQGAAILRAIKI